MQTIKIDIKKITDEQVDLIVDYLKNGKVIAYPTDTIYGLGCDAREALAVIKIKQIKGQKDNKPMLVLISDYEMLKRYCIVNEEQEKYLKTIWLELNPGLVHREGRIVKSPEPPLLKGAKTPVTVILESRKNLPDEITRPSARQAGGLGSLAVRLPDNEFLVKIISKADFPVVSTSLNKTGEPPLGNVQNLEKHFERLPDLAIDAGECKNTRPSKLIDLRDVRNIKVIRE